MTRRLVVLAALVVLAGCGSAHPHVAATPTSSSVTLPVGPGPQKTYRVQPQPPAGACRIRTDGTYPLPDPVCTPGAINPAVTQANIHSTICRKGYATSIRPPVTITGPEKHANATSYGRSGSLATTEYDHLVALGIGGDPNDSRNLWVEPNDLRDATTVRNTKDRVEAAVAAAICTGRLTLARAQTEMATNWPQLGRDLHVIY